MKSSFFFVYFFCITLTSSSVLAQATVEAAVEVAEVAEATHQAAVTSPNTWFVYAIILLAFMGSIVSMLLIRSALMNSQWSLADALSEQVELTEKKIDGNLLMENNQPVLIKKMQPSSSRMIALLGTVAILFLFLSFGAFALFHFAQSGQMPDGINRVVTFLTAGLILFAPYIVNKFSNAFEALSPKR